jgi:hypothetical protein
MSTALPTTPWRIFSRFNRSRQTASFSAQRETVESAGLRTLGAFRHGFVFGLVDATHRGILVMLRNETLTKHKDGLHWRFTDYAA